jgi:hypothetical protein
MSGLKMLKRRVGLTSDVLGRQFNPYLQGMVLPGGLDVNGEITELLVQIDPIKVDPRSKPFETWETEIVHPFRYQFYPKLSDS